MARNVADLMPASSPGEASFSSVFIPRRSAQRISVRSSISAQSWESVPPGAGVHRDHGVAGVVVAGEQARLLQRREARLDRRALLLDLRRDRVVLRCHPLELLEVADVGLERAELLEAALHARVLGGHLGGVGLVVPEPLGAHLRLEGGGALL